MKKRVVMTIAGIMGGTFTSSAVALAQTKTKLQRLWVYYCIDFKRVRKTFVR